MIKRISTAPLNPLGRHRKVSNQPKGFCSPQAKEPGITTCRPSTSIRSNWPVGIQWELIATRKRRHVNRTTGCGICLIMRDIEKAQDTRIFLSFSYLGLLVGRGSYFTWVRSTAKRWASIKYTSTSFSERPLANFLTEARFCSVSSRSFLRTSRFNEYSFCWLSTLYSSKSANNPFS